MKPQRFWAVTSHGELYAHNIYDQRADAVESAKCHAGYRNCPECKLQLVLLEVRVVKPKPKPRKARRKP